MSTSTIKEEKEEPKEEVMSNPCVAEILLKHGIVQQIPSRKDCIERDESFLHAQTALRGKRTAKPLFQRPQRRPTHHHSSSSSIRSSIIARVFGGFAAMNKEEEQIALSTAAAATAVEVDEMNEEEEEIQTVASLILVAETKTTEDTSTQQDISPNEEDDDDNNKCHTNVDKNEIIEEESVIQEAGDDIVLYELFRTFCTPHPTLQQITSIVESYNNEKMSTNTTDLPQNAVICMGEGGTPVYRLLSSSKVLFMLPNFFQLTFFRILIRLLTNVNDSTYHLQFLNNNENEVDPLLLKQMTALSKGSQDLTRSNTTETTPLTTPQDVIATCPQPMPNTTSIAIAPRQERLIEDPLFPTLDFNEYNFQEDVWYSIVRMRCSNEWKRYTQQHNPHVEPKNGSIAALIHMIQSILSDSTETIRCHLLMPVCCLLSLLVSSGIGTPRELRQLLDLLPLCNAATRVYIFRILRYAATAETFLPKTFFTFDNGLGLSIPKTKPCWPWPFRNDFGFAVWIRAQTFETSSDEILLVSVQSEDGFGIEVRLEPVYVEEHALATIAVRVTSNTSQQIVDEVRMADCIQLSPRKWYHIALRHTAPATSTLKGYFTSSLIAPSLKEELCFFLNGKPMKIEELVFPNKKLLSTSTQNTNNNKSGMAELRFAQHWIGETSTLYVWNEFLSDSAIKALYEHTASEYSNRKTKPCRQKSLNITPGSSTFFDPILRNEGSKGAYETLPGSFIAPDAKEAIAFQSSSKCLLDLVDSSNAEMYHHDGSFVDNDLYKANFSSKVCLVWDPSRITGQIALEVHMGAHAFLNTKDTHAWTVSSARNVLKSLGGIPVLIKTFQQLLQENNNVDDVLLIPNLIFLLATYTRNDSENARALLLCEGVDILEQWIEKRKKTKGMRAVRASETLSRFFVRSLFYLRQATSHNFALETKIFTCLVLNFHLWFCGGIFKLSEVAFYKEFLPILSTLATHYPNKVRECADVRNLIQCIHELTYVGEDQEDILNESSLNRLFDRSFDDRLLGSEERRHLVDIILGILVTVMTPKTTTLQLEPLVNYISFCLDAEFEIASKTLQDNDEESRQSGSHSATLKVCTILLFLLQVRPIIPGLYESLEICLGSKDGVASWILCCMVNSFDDSIRSTGIRSLTAYMDGLPSASSLVEAFPLKSDSYMKTSMVTTPLLKSVTKIKNLAHSPENFTKLNVKVVHKLLFHLLKCHRDRLGDQSHDALVYLLVDDASNKNAYSEVSRLVIPDRIFQQGFKFNDGWSISPIQLAIDSSQKLRSAFAINTILRLLRFLHPSVIEKWLFDLLTFVRINPNSMATVLPTSEWQPCLFFLLSEIVEETSRQQSKAVLSSTDFDNVTCHDDTETTRTKEESGTCVAVEAIQSCPASNLAGVEKRFDLCTKLYATFLGNCIRQGDKCYEVVEKVASLQRVCINGHEIFGIVLSHLLNELTECGTVEIASSPKPNEMSFERSWALKQSALAVTNAIMSNGTNEMDLTTAVKHWRCLRHLTSITVAFITASGYGVVDLFDYRNEDASVLDSMTGGLQGIRLPDSTLSGLKASDILIGRKRFESGVLYEDQMRLQQRRGYKLMCVTLAAQMLSLLDAFIFPDSLDTSLPASQLHGLALVRSTEPRLGSAQGPLLLSLLRLSLVLLSHLDPSSVKFLQCCGRLRCLLHWTLELIRESVALGGYSAAFQDLTAPLDRLVLAIVLQAHRALKKCCFVLVIIETAPPKSEESRNKNSRRLFRATFELREIVLAAYRGRNEVLRAALSLQAYDALQSGLEELVPLVPPANELSTSSRSQREANLRLFLRNSWVQGFADIDISNDIAFPEQVSNGQVFRGKTSSSRGNTAIIEISQESRQIVEEYHHALDKPFESYCEDQRQWAETDAVRDLEYEGDVSIRNLSEMHGKSHRELARSCTVRTGRAVACWDATQHKIPDVRWFWVSGKYTFSLEILHWKIAKAANSLHRRQLLTQNHYFTSHADASYESMLGRERERERERLLKAKLEREQKQLSEIMLKNASTAFFKVPESSDVDDENIDENIEPTDGETEDEKLDVSVVNQLSFDLQSKAELIDETKDSFSWANAFIWEDNEKIVQLYEPVLMVSLRRLREGRLLLTSHSIYFHQTSDDISVITKEKLVEKNKRSADRRWKLRSLVEVHGRRYLLRASALELFFSDCREIFISFQGEKVRDAFFVKLRSCRAPLLKLPKSLNPRIAFKKSRITELWRRRKISNFQYLMQLNLIAGRTFNDINQYPVFPWVLSNYTSRTLNLKDPNNFRDLTKPIGALNPERLNILIERFKDLDGFFNEDERFLYGSHYSSPGAVLYYMIRQEPFTSMHIELQSGRFDVPDRLFFDMAGCWRCCLKLTSDVKELIPEFFSCPEMFLNTNNFPLGTTQEGLKVDDVILPPWAKGSAHEFVRKHALALESEYVSQNLNHWIDLVFGFKQRGPAAAAAHNVFHFLSYEGTVDLDSITNKVDREATESHIQNFGQTPSQLILKDPHPSRYPASDVWGPLINEAAKFRDLRCWTPSKQFGVSDSCGAVLSIHVLTEHIVVIYSNMSVGTYRWSNKGIGNAPFLFKPDKLRQIGERAFFISPAAASGSSTIDDHAASSHYRARMVAKQLETTTDDLNCHMSIDCSSFGVSIGGYLKDNFSRKNGASGSRSLDGNASLDSSFYLLSCGYWDGTLKMHSLEGLRLKCSVNGGHSGPITCLSIGECHGLMVTGGQDATCRIWAVDHPNLAIALTGGTAYTSSGDFGESDQGGRLLSCCHVLLGQVNPISCVAFSSDLDVVVSGSNDGLVCVHTARRGKFVRLIDVNNSHCSEKEQRSSAVRKLAMHPQGFVAHMADQMLYSLTINGTVLHSVSAEDTLHAMEVSSDGQMLITGGDKYEVVIRAIHTLTVRCVLDLSKHGPIRCISLTPPENNPAPQFMYIGTSDGLVTIVDTAHENIGK